MNAIIIICFVSLFVMVRYRRGVSEGVAAIVFFLVLLPLELRLQTPGALPELTSHRILLGISALFLLRAVPPEVAPIRLPGLKLLLLVLLSRFLSTLTAIDFLRSTKDLLSFLLETLFFYVLIMRGIRDRETLYRVLRAIMYASVIVACVATVEKYRRVNLVDQIIPMLDDWKSVTATYRHRILLGYAMALPFSVAFVLRTRLNKTRAKYAAWGGLILLPAACYFSNSRGPWAGMAIAGMVMVLTGSKQLRKPIKWLALLTVIVLILKPGVWHSLATRLADTKDTNTLKGRSASYRLELWKVAYKQISKSPSRFILGYGGQSTEIMQLGGEFEFGGGSSHLGHTSWDGELAADLMKYGTFGLFTEVLLYGGFLIMCFGAWWNAPPETKTLHSACLASVLVYYWAMTNVSIFNPQLTYLFWTLVAVSARAVALQWERQTVTTDEAEYSDAQDIDGASPAIEGIR